MMEWDDKRRIAILALIKSSTVRATMSRETARKVLINAGIYAEDGKLRVEFGG